MPAPASIPSRWREFLAGCRDESPILLGVAPFGMIYGVLALGAGLDAFTSQAMSSVVFAGSAQLIATRLIREGTPAAVLVMTIFVVNLRHALYSASLARELRPLSAGWKALLAYLLTDEAYAVIAARVRRDAEAASGSSRRCATGTSSAPASPSGSPGSSPPPPGSSWGRRCRPAGSSTSPWRSPSSRWSSRRSRTGPPWRRRPAPACWRCWRPALPFKLGLVVAAVGGIAAGLLVEARS